MGNYTSAEVLAIIGALTALLTSAIAGIVTIIVTIRSGAKTEKIATAIIGTENNAGLVAQVEKIHTLTNSTMTEIRAELNQTKSALAVADGLATSLKAVVAELKTEREKKEILEATKLVVVPSEPETKK